MLVWKGAGGLVVIIFIVVCLFVNIVTSAVFHEDNYFQAHLWPKLVAFGIMGILFWFLGRYLHSRPATLVRDERTGQEVEVKPYHDFMFIKLEYWGVISVLIGVALVVKFFAGK